MSLPGCETDDDGRPFFLRVPAAARLVPVGREDEDDDVETETVELEEGREDIMVVREREPEMKKGCVARVGGGRGWEVLLRWRERGEGVKGVERG